MAIPRFADIQSVILHYTLEGLPDGRAVAGVPQFTGYRPPHLAETILERWFSPGFAAQHPTAYRGYRNMLSGTPLQGYMATCAAIRDADLRELVPTHRRKIAGVVRCR